MLQDKIWEKTFDTPNKIGPKTLANVQPFVTANRKSSEIYRDNSASGIVLTRAGKKTRELSVTPSKKGAITCFSCPAIAVLIPTCARTDSMGRRNTDVVPYPV